MRKGLLCKFLLVAILLIVNINCGDQEKQNKKQAKKLNYNTILPIKITKKDHRQIIDVYNMAITIKVNVNEKKANGDSWDTIGDPDVAGIIKIHKVIYNGKEYRYKYKEKENKENFRIITNLSIGDLISFDFWDEDAVSNDPIGKNKIIFKGQQYIKLPLIYRGKSQGYVIAKIKPNKIIMHAYIENKQFTQKQFQFENNKLNWINIKNYIKEDEDSKIKKLEDEIRKCKKQMRNTSDQSERNYLMEKIRMIQEQINILKDPFKKTITKTYQLKDWICRLNNIYKNDNDNEIICDCIAGHKYIIHIPLNTTDSIITRTIPLFNRGDLIQFNGYIYNVYCFTKDYPIWDIKITHLNNRDANNRLISLIKAINNYEKYITDETNRIRSKYYALINKYPKLNDKHSQIEFEKALIYYYNDKKFSKELEKDLTLINNNLNKFKESISNIINTSSPYKYSLKDINLSKLNIDDIINFRKNYLIKLSKFKPYNWTGKIIKITKEREKEIKTDWGKIAGNFTLLILSGIAIKKGHHDVAENLQEILEAQQDNSFTKEVVKDVYYIYLEHNGLIWKIRINDKDKDKLFNKEKGDQIYFSGKLQIIDNKGIIHVKADSFY